MHWAQSVRPHFPDGRLFANLRGHGPGAPAEPGEVLHSFLRAFGVPAPDVPADLDGRSALLCSVPATRRVLVLLDNARSADQVRPPLPGHAGCVVVTKPDPDWRKAFAPFQVATDLWRASPAAVFLHDLPAHRGEEVATEVLDRPHSIAFRQPENKLYSAMATLEWCRS